MTSGQAVKYSSSFACFQEIIAKEGMSSLFKGAGANVLRAVAGAGVLSGYDALQVCLEALGHSPDTQAEEIWERRFNIGEGPTGEKDLIQRNYEKVTRTT